MKLRRCDLFFRESREFFQHLSSCIGMATCSNKVTIEIFSVCFCGNVTAADRFFVCRTVSRIKLETIWEMSVNYQQQIMDDYLILFIYLFLQVFPRDDCETVYKNTNTKNYIE